MHLQIHEEQLVQAIFPRISHGGLLHFLLHQRA